MPPVTVQEAFQIALQHHQAGRLAEAEGVYLQILAQDPNHADARHLLGVLAHQVGQDEIAMEMITQALALVPGSPEFCFSLGVVCRKMGRIPDAEAAYRRAIASRADYADAYVNLGNLLRDEGRLDESVAVCRRVLEIAPTMPEAHNNLGVLLRQQHRLDEAAAACRRAIELQPEYVEAHYNLGCTLREHGNPGAAAAACSRAVELRPDFAAGHLALGDALMDLGQPDSAVMSYRTALRLKPESVEAHNALGNALMEKGLPDEAAKEYRFAIRLRPESAEAHSNLGNALKETGRLDDAIAAYRESLRLKPDLPVAHSNLIFALDEKEGAELALQQEERRLWFEQHGRKFASQMLPHANDPDPGRRLRIGYVSADFRRHSASYAFAPVICHHDPVKFEVFCYSDVRREDDATARLRRAAHVWRPTLGMTDDRLAAQIREDRIDILVDLAGHSAGNRLLVFARKPAPVQVTAWGHATGTGMKTMDYFFADPVYVPAEQRGLFAEEVIDLPCFLFYEPPEYLPEITALPALEGEPLTYGCVNRLEKIRDGAIALWGRILRGSPGARLVVKDKGLGEAAVRQAFLGRLLRAGGIEESRVRLFGASAHAEHLKIFHQIDIGLDPFPQSGGASTGEALWMGVPVVTLPGATASSRCTAAILSAVGMRDWIAHSEDEYVRIAVRAGDELARLDDLRKHLRALLRESPYGDGVRYTRAVEQAYRRMWQTWCGKPALHP